jgi:hypothetical protein
MRGIVTDLTLRLGTAYDFGKYQWAAGLEGNVYKQTNDVDFITTTSDKNKVSI